MSDRLEALKAEILKFRDEREWAQFHTLRNLITALSIEAGELLELTLWKTDDALEKIVTSAGTADALKNECADVLAYLILIADRAGFDLVDATRHKIELNALKYPVDKAKSTARKYDEL